MSGGERVTWWGRGGAAPPGQWPGAGEGQTHRAYSCPLCDGGLVERVWPLELPPHQPWCLMGRGTSYLLRNVPSAVLP